MHISLSPEILGYILGLPISNSFVLAVGTTIVLLLGGFLVIRSLRLIPERLQGLVESVVETILDFMTQVLGERAMARRFFPLVATIFLFVVISNWVGVFPGTGSLGLFVERQGERELLPLFRSAAADLNTTLALAIVAMVAVQWYGMRRLGIWGHWSRFFVFTKGPIFLFVGLLELMGEFTKVISFSFRLFGNIFAGEILLLVIMTLVPAFIPLPFLFLEFFVGFIQALVFAMLTLIFLKVATAEGEQ